MKTHSIRALNIKIHSYTRDRTVEIADLFWQSVHSIDSSIYTQQQKEVWAPTPPDYAFWEQRLTQKKPFLAMVDNQVVGFIELDSDGYIDCMYTHPNYQEQGIASALYNKVLEIARENKFSRLYVDASLIAMPFFEKNGFRVIKKNKIKRQNLTFINHNMELHLGVVSENGI